MKSHLREVPPFQSAAKIYPQQSINVLDHSYQNKTLGVPILVCIFLRPISKHGPHHKSCCAIVLTTSYIKTCHLPREQKPKLTLSSRYKYDLDKRLTANFYFCNRVEIIQTLALKVLNLPSLSRLQNYVVIPREGDTELLNFHSMVHYFPKLIAIATILINVCYFMAYLLTTLLFEPSRQTGKKYTIKMIQFIKEK